MDVLDLELPISIGRLPGSEAFVTLDKMDGALAKKLALEVASMDPWARYPYPAEALVGYLEAYRPDAPRYVLRHADVIIGACGLQLAWLRGPYVQFLALLPAFQGKGYGRLVLDWVEACARDSECRNIWVLVSDFNERARAFYKSAGFRMVCDLPDLVRDGRTEILMRKRI